MTQLNAGASNTTGTFTVAAAGLTASTQYTYRAFASNTAGVGYSAAANFTTAAPPNQAPTANAAGPYTAAEGGSVTLNGSGSSDPDGDPLPYTWDVDGDGAFDDATGVSPTLAATGRKGKLLRPGTYLLTVTSGTTTTRTKVWVLAN